jgi:putative effector of murein hydrolase
MNFLTQVFSSPVAGILLTICAYVFTTWLHKKTNIPFLHPMFMSIVLLVAFLLIFKVDYSVYENGGKIITSFFGPVTVCLAVPLYKNRNKLKQNILPILIATTIGSFASIVSVVLLGKILNLDTQILLSVIPRSITAPIGLELSTEIGGIMSITMLSIIVTGALGTVMLPILFKWCRVQDEVANGLAFGNSAHGMGVVIAMEKSELMGSMASLAMATTGVVSIFIAKLVLPFV